MGIWEADCYRRPLQDEQGRSLWELLICDTTFQFTYGAQAPQAEVTGAWVQHQLTIALEKAGQAPSEIRVFRPQALSLLQTAGQALGLMIRPLRYTPALKQWLVQRSQWYPTQSTFSGEAYTPLALEQPTPAPIPESLWGDQWRFASLPAQDFQERLIHEPIPIQTVPPDWLPLPLGLASTTMIPGLMIDAGPQAMALARWLQAQQPATLDHMVGAPDGVILQAGLVERWVLVTFDDPHVKAAAEAFTERQRQAQGLHFLLVRPDDSGITFTGLWLLRREGSLNRSTVG